MSSRLNKHRNNPGSQVSESRYEVIKCLIHSMTQNIKDIFTQNDFPQSRLSKPQRCKFIEEKRNIPPHISAWLEDYMSKPSQR